MPPSRTWTELHNSRHPRGMELQRKLERGHVLTDYQMNSLYAQPTAKWWTQRDAKAGACALRRMPECAGDRAGSRMRGMDPHRPTSATICGSSLLNKGDRWSKLYTLKYSQQGPPFRSFAYSCDTISALIAVRPRAAAEAIWQGVRDRDMQRPVPSSAIPCAAYYARRSRENRPVCGRSTSSAE